MRILSVIVFIACLAGVLSPIGCTRQQLEQGHAAATQAVGAAGTVADALPPGDVQETAQSAVTTAEAVLGAISAISIVWGTLERRRANKARAKVTRPPTQ